MSHFRIVYPGIPKAALEKLEKLRLSLEAKKSSGQSEGSPVQAEATPPAKSACPLLVDVGANLTNFRCVCVYVCVHM